MSQVSSAKATKSCFWYQTEQSLHQPEWFLHWTEWPLHQCSSSVQQSLLVLLMCTTVTELFRMWKWDSPWQVGRWTLGGRNGTKKAKAERTLIKKNKIKELLHFYFEQVLHFYFEQVRHSIEPVGGLLCWWLNSLKDEKHPVGDIYVSEAEGKWSVSTGAVLTKFEHLVAICTI